MLRKGDRQIVSASFSFTALRSRTHMRSTPRTAWVLCYFAFLASLVGCEAHTGTLGSSDNAAASTAFNDGTSSDIEILRSTYPIITAVERDGERLYFKLQNGSRLLYDDGRPKDVAEKIESPDLEDTLSIPYPLGDVPQYISDPNSDPGRSRSDQLLAATYGASPEAVQSKLVRVDFCGTPVMFNAANGAADSLRRVTEEACSDPALAPYFAKLGGTYNWRPIAGTERLSAHSYGIAIDLNPDLGGYWRWSRIDPAKFDRSSFPQALVDAFEANGFIWGGKWYHFDLMHFEYRPEIITKYRR
jgi:hypothetical protein